VALWLDHVFVMTKPGAGIADALVTAGFIEGSTSQHPGQGTANRRFFFNDFTLELLYVDNEHDARTGAGRELGFAERMENPDASRFGVVVRSDVPVTFPHWQYWPDYFEGKMHFAVAASDQGLKDPLFICMPLELPTRTPPPELNYTNKGLTRCEITMPNKLATQISKLINGLDNVSVGSGASAEMLIRFNDGSASKRLDLAPDAPLVLVW